MPFCPNPKCEHRKRLGEPAEFRQGITICSDCGSTLSEIAPTFKTEKAAQKVQGWTCPQCGLINREEISLCSCGFDFNRPYILRQATKAVEPGLKTEDKSKESGEQRPKLPIAFNGKPREYFRIWIVNLCLTLLTFGIYSAWAKVRKKRYFYSHTILDGTPFQYLGQPIPILKGRVIAAILFLLYYVSSHFLSFLLPYVLLAGAALTPWVIVRSAAFNCRYSAFRNMTFHYDGRYRDALRALYALGIIPVLALGITFNWWQINVITAISATIIALSFPWWIKRLKNLLISHSTYGGKRGVFSATGGQFFAVYFKSGLIMGGTLLVAGIFSAILIAIIMKKTQIIIWLTLIPFYAGYILAYAHVQAYSSNLVWNHTQLGPIRFQSTLRGMGMAKLYVSNAIAIIASLGLLIPWAVVRTLKYRADNMRVFIDGELLDFEGKDMSAVEAIGAETLDFFDMDLSL